MFIPPIDLLLGFVGLELGWQVDGRMEWARLAGIRPSLRSERGERETERECVILHNTLYNSEVKLPVPAVTTAHGLQQSLDLLEQYCQTWANKYKNNDFPEKIQRRSRSQGIRPKFSIGRKYIEYCTHYNEAVN